MELYNAKEKEEFLDTIEAEDIKNLYRHLFSKSRGAEILYQKDLYAFSLRQIEDVMRNVNPATLNSSANTKSRINHYITWAISNGRRTNNINPIQGASREWEKKFIDKSIKRYLSDSELYDIVESLYNAQDQALIQCLFEGIMGQGLSELISMKYDNINWDSNEVRVTDQKDGKTRIVVVSDRCMRYLENAYKQTSYISENTETEKELIEFDNRILKNIRWRTSKFDEVSRVNLTKRLYHIQEKYELQDFTRIRISESGRIKMAYDLYKERGVLGKEEFYLIGDKFNLTKMKIRGYEYYDITKMKHYINSKTLKELYDVDIEID